MEHQEDSTLTSNSTFATSRKDRLYEIVNDKLLENFTPAYFVSIMGTGISSCILYRFPYPGEWLQICGIIMWCIAIFFFLATTLFFILSVTKYQHNFTKFNTDPSVAVFLGCYPMGYTTLVNFLYFLTGKSWIIGVYVLWWISVVLSLYTACLVFYFALIAKKWGKDNMMDPKDLHATLLLPIVTLTVAASSGGIITLDLPSLNLQIITLVVCYVLWSNAIAIAFIIITIYFWKLFVYKVPPTNLVFTSFLPVGVLGQGAYGILLFGDNVYKLIMEHRSSVMASGYLSYIDPSMLGDDTNSVTLSLIVGNIVLYISSMISLYLTSFGYFCTFIAIVSCLSKIHPFTRNYNKHLTYHPSEDSSFLKQGFKGFLKFNKTFWAMTFPLGTMALSNNELSRIFNGLKAFKVIGTIYAVALLLITIGCLIGCLYKLNKLTKYILHGHDTNHIHNIA